MEIPRRSSSLRPLAAVALVAALATSLLVAFPTSALAARHTVFHQVLKGMLIDVFSSTISDDGCTETATLINVVKLREEEWQAFYTSFITNTCTGEVSLVYGAATPTEISYRGNLDSAHLVATIPLIDNDTGAPVGTTTVNLTWTPSGPLTTDTITEIQKQSGVYRFSIRDRVTGRPADATGYLTGFGSGPFTGSGHINKFAYHTLELTTTG